MKSTIIKMPDIVLAEIYKLKASPVIYLVLTCCIFVTGIVFLASTLDVHARAGLNIDPWVKHFMSGMAIYSLFIICPLAILLVSTVVYIEQRANTWKYLYTMPVKRSAIYFSKLAVIIAILIAATGFLLLTLVGIGYLINGLYPEYEFSYHSPDILALAKTASHTLIATLGIIAVQYFFTIVFKHFLVPIGVGILGYILGFILTSTNHVSSLYFPFTYPMIVQDFQAFSSDHRSIIWGDWLTNVELYSLLFFVVFIMFGYFYETKRNIA